MPFEANTIEYGRYEHDAKGLGDPISVNKQTRPVRDSLEKWAAELAQDAGKLQLVRDMVAAIDDADLETWGYPRASYFQPVERAARSVGRALAEAPALVRFRLERKLLILLRRNIQHNTFGRLVRRTRLLCDVLLRG